MRRRNAEPEAETLGGAVNPWLSLLCLSTCHLFLCRPKIENPTHMYMPGPTTGWLCIRCNPGASCTVQPTLAGMCPKGVTRPWSNFEALPGLHCFYGCMRLVYGAG
jgi:hypothetical protein